MGEVINISICQSTTINMPSVSSLENTLAANMQNVAWGTTRRAETDFRSKHIPIHNQHSTARLRNSKS